MGPKGEGTAQRLVDAALNLFADKGYDRTTTADIEQAAGLTPGAGGMYRHFASKAALIEAAIDAQRPALAALESARELLPLGDLRSELVLLARGALAAISESRQVLDVIERERHVLRDHVVVAHDILEHGYVAAADFMIAILRSHHIAPPPDASALAVVAVGALASYARETRIYGSAPGSVSEERFVAAWVQTWHSFALTLPGATAADDSASA